MGKALLYKKLNPWKLQQFENSWCYVIMIHKDNENCIFKFSWCSSYSSIRVRSLYGLLKNIPKNIKCDMGIKTVVLQSAWDLISSPMSTIALSWNGQQRHFQRNTRDFTARIGGTAIPSGTKKRRKIMNSRITWDTKSCPLTSEVMRSCCLLRDILKKYLIKGL